jgi:hypothetical protein
MPTLIIHASDARARKGSKSFESVLDDGIGDGYALSSDQYQRLEKGDPVVLLRKDRNKRRAEGRLVELVATGRTTPQGLQRYDVYLEDLKWVEYKPEPLNRYGVNVI